MNIFSYNITKIRSYKTLLLGSAAFAALAFMPNHAFAANECGVAVAGGTITCDGDGNPVTDVNPYANGISYTVDGQILNVNGAATTITSGANHGVHLQGTAINAIEINTAGTLSITSAGNNTNGIFGDHTGSGTVTINSSSVISIAAGGGVFNGSGIFARISNAASTSTVVVNATGGTITAGPGGDNRGILAQHLGLGAVTVNSGANISSTGNVGVGIQSTSSLATSNAINTINVTGGTISTTGSTGIGILGRSRGNGALNISSAAIITTAGTNSWGIYGNHQGNGITTIDFTGGSVATTGNNSKAIFGRNQGSGAININATGGTVSTAANNSHGIEGRQDGSGDINITSAINITTTGASSRGIEANMNNAASAGETTINATGGVINSSGEGIAAFHNGAGSSGNINITNAATITSTNATGIIVGHTGTGNLTINSSTNITTNSAFFGAIRASQSGTGTSDITVSGGIFALNGGTGISSTHSGAGASGALNITSSAIMTGTGRGIAASAQTGNNSAIDINANGGSIALSGTGISGTTRGLGTVSIESAINVSTTDGNAHALDGRINNVASAAAVTITTTGGILSTIGGDARGISSEHQGTGLIEITSAAMISTIGAGATGIFADITNAANLAATTINVTGGQIMTSGSAALGVFARTTGQGAININSAGNVATLSDNSSAIIAQTLNTANASTITINATAGTITTAGANSRGILAVHELAGGTGAINITSAANISTNGVGAAGNNSAGIGAEIRNAANASAVGITATGGTISTSGNNSAGIFVRQAGTGTINVTSAAAITVIGTGSHGVSVLRTGAGSNNITVSGMASAQSGDGVRTEGIANDLSTITLNNGANVSSATGSAIFNDEGDSAVSVNAGAIVNGAVRLGDGDDALTFNGGSLAAVTTLDGGDDIFVGDGFIDTLTFAGSTGMLTGANVINWERIIIGAGSTISFTDAALTAGLTTINNGGTFDAGNGFALSSDLTLNAGGIFDATGGGAGIFSIIGTTMNGGTLTTQDGVTGDRLTIEGAYTGNNGRVHIDTVLGDDASATDMFIVNNGTAGTTTLNVQNAGGTGAATVAGIKVITINGGPSNGTFVLDGDHLTAGGKQAIVGGAFSYTLEKQGSGDWHLISSVTPAVVVVPVVPGVVATPAVVVAPVVATPLFQPGSPAYEAYPQTLQALTAGQSYYQRVGSKFASFDNGEPQNGDGTTSASSTYGNSEGQRGPFWGKVSGQYAHVEPDLSTTSTRYNIRSGKMQIGIDMLAHEGASGNLFFGVTGQYGFANADITSIFGNGSVKTKAYGVGVTSSWIAANGFYLDGQAHFNWFDSDLNSDTLGRLTSDNDGFGQSWSLEAGMPIEAGNGWMVTPQAQLTYSNIRFEQFIGRSGELVSLGDGNSLIGRAGLSIARDTSWTGDNGSISRGHFYGIANVYHQFEDGTETIVSGTSLFDRQDDLSGEIGVGFNVSWDDDKYSLYGDVIASTSLQNTGDSYAFGGTVGFKVRF